MIVYKKGDIFETDEAVIAHGVNCSGGFGSGIARTIAERYASVRENYLKKYNEAGWKLGEVQTVQLDDNSGRTIVNCATQQQYGKPVDMFKNPKTDSGTKKSAKGLLRVNADLTLSQQVTPEEEKGGLLEIVYLDGKLVRDDSLANIRARLLANLNND